MKHNAALFILIVFCMVCFAQVDTNTFVKDSLIRKADTTALIVSADSVVTSTPVRVPTAAVARDTTKSTLQVSKRKYNYKDQTTFAIIMMVFIAVVITTAQNWNPD